MRARAKTQAGARIEECHSEQITGAARPGGN
jgi:hypothetical protein